MIISSACDELLPLLIENVNYLCLFLGGVGLKNWHGVLMVCPVYTYVHKVVPRCREGRLNGEHMEAW